jgi:hypothetical protein
MDGGSDVLAKGDQAGFPAQLDSFFSQLLSHGFPVRSCGHENIKIFFLEFSGQLNSDFVSGTVTHTGRETRGCAIDELDAPFPHDDVVGRT